MNLSRFIKKVRRHRHGVGISFLALSVIPTAFFYFSEPLPKSQRLSALFSVKGESVTASSVSAGDYSLSSSSSTADAGSSSGGSVNFDFFNSSNSAAVPEPASLLLMAPAVLLLRKGRRR